MNSLPLPLRRLSFALAFASAGVLTVWGQGQVVYDNTANTKDFSVRTAKELGDEITLGGTARTVTTFVFEYFGDFAPGTTGAAAILRFYANDGSLFTNPSVPRPGTLLWESSPIGLLDNFRRVTVSVPNIEVPDTFTWSIQSVGLSGAVGNSIRLTVSDPVSVGGLLPAAGGGTVVGSYGDYWQKDNPLNADSWALYNLGSQNANFYAQVTAIPEPGTVALFVVGTGALVVWGRRSRR